MPQTIIPHQGYLTLCLSPSYKWSPLRGCVPSATTMPNSGFSGGENCPNRDLDTMALAQFHHGVTLVSPCSSLDIIPFIPNPHSSFNFQHGYSSNVPETCHILSILIKYPFLWQWVHMLPPLLHFPQQHFLDVFVQLSWAICRRVTLRYIPRFGTDGSQHCESV